MLSRVLAFFSIPSNLWIIDTIQAAPVGRQHLPELGFGVGFPDHNILPLQLATQPLNPVPELPFKLGPVDHHDDCWRAELLLSFQDQASGSEQGEGLAGPLRMPNQSAPPGRLGAALDDPVDGTALMLSQN